MKIIKKWFILAILTIPLSNHAMIKWFSTLLNPFEITLLSGVNPQNATFIFDFDGTIANSWPTIKDCINENSLYYGYKPIEDLDSLKNKNILTLLQELGIWKFQVPFIAKSVRTSLSEKITSIETFPEIPSVIEGLYKRHINLGIMSSNSHANIEMFLKQHNLHHYFNFICSNIGIWGKEEALKSLVQSYDLNKESVIYIGDEQRDLEAAQINNVKDVGVTWGFHTENLLKEKNPHFIAKKPTDLLSLVP